MSDLVKQLKEVDPYGDDPGVPAGLTRLCHEAADRIAKLEAERDAAKFEVERLRVICLDVRDAASDYNRTRLQKDSDRLDELVSLCNKPELLKIPRIQEAVADEVERIKSEELAKLRLDYNNLIMAVKSVFPGETRHQAALRYITQAECSAKGA